MIEKLCYWLIDRVADFLGGLNPERAKKIEAIKAETAQLEAAHKALDEKEAALAKRLADSLEQNKELQAKIDEVNRGLDEKEQVLAELRRQDKEIDDALVAAKSSIDQKTDAEKVRLDL